MTWEEMYDILEDEIGICKQALDLAFGLNGCTVETAESILFWATGNRSFEQYFEECGE